VDILSSKGVMKLLSSFLMMAWAIPSPLRPISFILPWLAAGSVKLS
jgi:hypothetical protein